MECEGLSPGHGHTNHSHLQPKNVRTELDSPDCAEYTITWVFSLFVRSVFCPELLTMILAKLFLHGKKAQASPALCTEKLVPYRQLHMKNWFIMKENTTQIQLLRYMESWSTSVRGDRAAMLAPSIKSWDRPTQTSPRVTGSPERPIPSPSQPSSDILAWPDQQPRLFIPQQANFFQIAWEGCSFLLLQLYKISALSQLPILHELGVTALTRLWHDFLLKYYCFMTNFIY